MSTDTHAVSRELHKRVIWTRFVDLAERRPLWFLAVWIALFTAAVLPGALCMLSYDELLTYYGATAPTFAKFYSGIMHFDFNPPLLYGLVGLSVRLFGDSVLMTRLPAIVSFLGASCLLFWHVRRRSGGSYGLLAVGIFFSVGFFRYAYEARPYTLALFFFTLAFVCWSEAAGCRKWSVAHAGLAVGISGMFLSHCFAAPFALSIAVGEFAKAKAQPHVQWDKKIWIALASPLPLLAIYLPLFRQPSQLLFPLAHMANWTTWFSFYGRVILANFTSFGLGIAAALLIPQSRSTAKTAPFSGGEWAFLLAAMLTPIPLIAYTIQAQMPYPDRYGIWVALPVTLLIVAVVERLAKRAPAAALLAAFLICVNFCANHLDASAFTSHADRVSKDLMNIPPGLPIVAAAAAHFLELDHSEPSDFVSRLYYLTDREAEIRYMHSTAFERFGIAKQVYPVRARIEPYPEFVASHKHFLVVLFPGDAAQSWIVQKLKADGATVQTLHGTPFYLEVFRP